MVRQAKEKRYPDDRRVVIVCGMRGENVRVEWCEEKDYPEAIELDFPLFASSIPNFLISIWSINERCRLGWHLKGILQ